MGLSGKRIQEAREALGYSVDDLAKLMNKHRATIYRYEKDEIKNCPSEIVEHFASVLQTTPAYLMGWTNDPNDIEDPNILRRDAMIEHAVAVLNQSGYNVDFADNDADGAVVRKGSNIILTSLSAIVIAYEAFDRNGEVPTADQLLGKIKKDPQPEDRPEVTEDDIKFALFGGAGEITDEMYDEVKEFVKFVKMKHGRPSE